MGLDRYFLPHAFHVPLPPPPPSLARGGGVGRKIVTTLSNLAQSAGCYKVICSVSHVLQVSMPHSPLTLAFLMLRLKSPASAQGLTTTPPPPPPSPPHHHRHLHHHHALQVVLDCNDANVGFYEKVSPLPPPPLLSCPPLNPAQIGFARKENQMALYFQ